MTDLTTSFDEAKREQEEKESEDSKMKIKIEQDRIAFENLKMLWKEENQI